jgi:transcriptional regulator of acetoin/glycerol metabolism
MPLAQQAEPQPRPAPPKPETVASLTESAPAAEVGGVALGDGEGGIISIEDLKQQAVERAYRLCDGNVDKAAVELGIGRATMYRLLKKYGVMT